MKPWSERVQTAKTIEILDEIIDGGGRRFQRTPAGGSIYDDNFDDDEYEMSTLRHNQLAGQSQFLDEYYNDNSDSLKESSFLSVCVTSCDGIFSIKFCPIKLLFSMQ